MHGFATPLGKLNERPSMFTYMVRSGQPNPAWVQLRLKVGQQLNAKFQQAPIDNRAARERIMARHRPRQLHRRHPRRQCPVRREFVVPRPLHRQHPRGGDFP